MNVALMATVHLFGLNAKLHKMAVVSLLRFFLRFGKQMRNLLHCSLDLLCYVSTSVNKMNHIAPEGKPIPAAIYGYGRFLFTQ